MLLAIINTSSGSISFNTNWRIMDKEYVDKLENAVVKYQSAFDVVMKYFNLLPEDVKRQLDKELKEYDL